MKTKAFFKYAAATIATSLIGIPMSFATTVKIEGLESQLNNVTENIAKIANPIINIILAIVGVIAIGVIAWAFSKKKKGQDGANDAIMDTAWTTLAVVAFIYVVKSFFFGL